MIASTVTSSKTGEPLDERGNKLAVSSYQPSEEIMKLYARVQADYDTAWSLQNRPFDEFDGYSLLQRTRMDQQTFGAFVGASYDSAQSRWRWKGRKNTARNKVIGILAHVISGMLFPMCYAYNEENMEDALSAKVMRILVENHLKKANYELKFLFMMTSALVNPAVFVEVEYVEAIQRIKVRNNDGTYRIEEAVDELLSGIGLNILPIDTLLLGDFYTFDIQRQPYIVKVRRISYDEARSVYSGKYYDKDGVDQFDYVQAGMTRVLLTGQNNQTLYDIEWTDADKNFVQEITVYYRSEDSQFTFVGGVFMGNQEDIYLSNPFKHRRMSVVKDEYTTVPVYPFAKSGFEPLDPSGRFAYYKSACFKEFWDDAAQNRMHQIAFDGTYLDVIKPMFMTGVSKVDSTVLVPGATIGMPTGATVTPYQLGPNLQGALQMMRVEEDDLSESTQDALMSGIARPGVTATASIKAEQNAKVVMSVFSTMIADLVRQVGELVMDDIICYTTVGEVDASVPESLKMKYRSVKVQGRDNGKDITSQINFSTEMMDLTPEDIEKKEWELFHKHGGLDAKTIEYQVNPYKFARTQFSLYIDPQQIISRSMGTDQLRKERAIGILMSPQVAPFVNQEEVVNKFILEDYSDGDPDQFKAKKPDMLEQIMGGAMSGAGPVGPAPGQVQTPQQNPLQALQS